MGAKFGDSENPLLLSCRSGARESMPGMMDTVLNLGLNDDTVQALAERSGNPRFAWDSYRRFLQMFGDVRGDAIGIPSLVHPVTQLWVVHDLHGLSQPATSLAALLSI